MMGKKKSKLRPDVDVMLDHLNYLFGDLAANINGNIEIAYTSKSGALNKAEQFFCADLEDAAEFAAEVNAQEGVNVYVGAALRHTQSEGRADDTDAAWASYAWADFDEEDATDHARDVSIDVGARPNMVVVTGRHPHTRAQYWWRLDEPVSFEAAGDPFTNLLQNMADNLGGDTTVTNPSRVMRLAGSIAWPHKKGRQAEMTELHVMGDRQAEFPIAQLINAFPPKRKESTQSKANFTGIHENVDIGHLLKKAMEPGHWWHSVRDAVAALINRGMSEDEVVDLLMHQVTTDGHSLAETDKQLRVMYQGAARKWGDEIRERQQEREEKREKKKKARERVDGEDQSPLGFVQTADFLNELEPMDFLLDGILRRRFIYSMTAKTGHGKTAVALRIAVSVATGSSITGHEAEKGKVAFFAGENPDDVRIRLICMLEQEKIDPADIDIYFISLRFDIEEAYDVIKEECDKLGGVDLIIVDTAAAYFQGDDDNSNAEMGRYGYMLRGLCSLPGGPTILVPSHPTKAATKDNLIPRGGGAFLNEVDGNITLWQTAGAVTMHHQGKYRGPEWQPITFSLDEVKSENVKDTKGRKVPSVMAVPMSETEAEAHEDQASKDMFSLLRRVNDYPKMSMSWYAENLGWMSGAMGTTPNKSKVNRLLDELIEEGLVRKVAGKCQPTQKGKHLLDDDE